MTDNSPLPVGAFTFVLHGAGGDLAKRKIIPALAHLAKSGYFSNDSRIIFAQREALTPTEALAQVDAFLKSAGDEAARESIPALLPYLHTLQVVLGTPESCKAMADAVAGTGTDTILVGIGGLFGPDLAADHLGRAFTVYVPRLLGDPGANAGGNAAPGGVGQHGFQQHIRVVMHGAVLQMSSTRRRVFEREQHTVMVRLAAFSVMVTT